MTAQTASERAAARVTFQLTYDRTDQPRTFQPGALEGPWIPCAYGSTESQPGGWYQPDDDHGDDHPDTTRTENQWIDRYAGYAVAEAVHEALEWFRVDGRPWLDPHGRAEDEIHAAVAELAAKLAAIRARHATQEVAR